MVLRWMRPSGRERSAVSLRVHGLATGAGAALLMLAGTGGSASAADPVDPQCTMNSQQAKICLTLTDSPDPVAYSSLDGTPTYISYRAIVSNASRSSSASHVQLVETLPAGTGFVRVTTTRGTCSGGASVVCAIGSLKKRQSATVDVVVTAPATGDPNAPDQDITDVATASFDERFNDTQENGGRQDTVTTSETTAVRAFAGETFVPQGASATVGTDPDALQSGDVAITNASTDLLASLRMLPPDDFCLLGQVTIQGTPQVCRNGGWLNASVVQAANGQPYFNAVDRLVFHLQWDGSLSSLLQTEDNFVVFYRTGSGGTTQVFDDRCDDPGAGATCLDNIKEAANGSWSVDLFKPDNGHMR